MKKNVFNILVLMAYALITLFIVLHHEIWADEAQVWQLCKHLSIPELINHLHNEGHPPLMYLLVMPFAKLTSNILFMQIICWAFMCLSAGLLLFYAPFKTITKIAILLSAGFIYFLPVIARSYALLPFLVFWAAILYSKQKEHPILYCSVIAVLANLHIIMLCFSFLLFVDFLIKNKNELSKKNLYLSGLIPVVSFLVVVFQLWNTTSSNAYITFSLDYMFTKVLRVLSFFFFNAYNSEITFYDKLLYPLIDIPLLLVMIVVYLLCFISLFLNSKKLFFITFLSIAFQIGIYIFAYSVNIYPTRIFSAHIIMLFAMWVLSNSDKINEKYKICSKNSINILLIIFFILTSYNGINYCIKEVNHNYSDAKNVAEYLVNNTEDDALILLTCEPFSIPIVYYLEKQGKSVISAVRRTSLKYVVWDKNSMIVMAPVSWIDASRYYSYMNKTKNIYVIKPILENRESNTDLSEDYFDLVYNSQRTIEGNEEYKVYKYKNK